MSSEPTQAALLADLKERLLLMGSRVVDMVERAMRALDGGNEPLARQTIVADRRINQDEIEIDAHCAKLIQRGGFDEISARRVMAASKIVVDLERVGDLAVNICELVVGFEEEGIPGDVHELDGLSDLALAMLRDAIRAFDLADGDAALNVIDRDEEVDRRNRALLLDLTGRLSRGVGRPEIYVPAQSVALYLERVADHATNVAEQVVFMVQGRDIRHPGRRIR